MAGTLEARFTVFPGPVRFVSTFRGVPLPAAEVAALLPTRSTTNPSYFSLSARSFAEFDWLAVLDSAAYHRGGLSLTPARPNHTLQQGGRDSGW